MRIEHSVGDAYRNRRREIVVVVPKVWNAGWKAAAMLLLLEITLATVPGTAPSTGALADLAVPMIVLAFALPCFVDIAHAVVSLFDSDGESA